MAFKHACAFLVAAVALSCADHHPGAKSTVARTRLTATDAGAVGDGTTLNTLALQAAIDHLAAGGGGELVVPPGVFLSGALFLKPGVGLELQQGAVLKGSTERKDYPARRTRIEGHFEPWLPALINAEAVDHLRITGPGTLDGSGAGFWKDYVDAKKADSKTKNLDVPRPRLMFVQDSRDVRISGLTFKDSGFWNLHLYRCKDVVVEKSRFQVQDGTRCPSTDGTDIDSCQDVTIKECSYRVDDDCVCLKGSKGPFAMDDKDSPPVERIHVTGCTFERGGGVTLGSEATIVRDVLVEDCKFVGPVGVMRLKLRPDTPQLYENLTWRRITLDNEGGRILNVAPWRQYFDLKGQPPPKSIVRNVLLSDVKGTYGSWGAVEGTPGQTEIEPIRVENVEITLKNPKPPASGTVVLKGIVVNGENAAN